MLLDIFTPKKPPLFGMDISNSSIKMVELTLTGKGKLRLERFAVEPLPAEVMVDGEIKNQEELTDALKRALKTFASKYKHVAIGFPESLVITKRVTLGGQLSGDEIETEVRNETAKFIPWSIDEAAVDYQFLGPSEKSAGDNEVLIGTARSARVDEMIALAEAASLKPYIIDAEPLAVQAALNLVIPTDRHVDENIVYVDIGSQVTTITVYRNGMSIFSRAQSIGAAQLTSDIMRQYDVSAEQAHAIKIGKADVPEDYHASVLVPFTENVAQEVSRAVQMFTTSTQYTETNMLVLGGGSAVVDGMVEMVAERIGVPTRIANPFEVMEVGSSVDVRRLSAAAPSLLTACGLALRRFDDMELDLSEGDELSFVPTKKRAKLDAGNEAEIVLARPMLNLLPHRETRAKESSRQLGAMAGTAAALACGVGLMMHLALGGFILQQEERNEFIKAENVRLDKDIEEIKRLNGEIHALLARKQIIESLQSDRAQTIQIMDQMVRTVPAGLYLKTLTQTGLKINVKGLAMSNDLVSTFMANIAASPYLENPELVEIAASTVNNKRMSEFNLNFSLKRPKSEKEKAEASKSAVGAKSVAKPDAAGTAPAVSPAIAPAKPDTAAANSLDLGGAKPVQPDTKSSAQAAPAKASPETVVNAGTKTGPVNSASARKE